MARAVQEAYDDLRKKYPVLPSWDRIDFEFEICCIEREKWLLRQIRKQISERIDWLLQLLQGILQPDSVSLTEMYEFSCFSPVEKQKMMDCYKRGMIMHRMLLEADLELNERKEAAIVRKVTDDWPKLRKDVLPAAAKLKNCWSEMQETNEMLEYLG